MDYNDVKQGVTEELAILSSYPQHRIIELIDYSEDSHLDLIALMSATHKDVLTHRLCSRFLFLDQRETYNKLFSSIKSVEKLIDYVYEKSNQTLHPIYANGYY